MCLVKLVTGRLQLDWAGFQKGCEVCCTVNSQNPTLAFKRTFIESMSNCMVFLLDVILNLWNTLMVQNDQRCMWKDRTRRCFSHHPLLLLRQIYCVSSLINLSKSILKLLLFPDASSYFHTKAPFVVGYFIQLSSLLIFNFPVAELNKPLFFFR